MDKYFDYEDVKEEKKVRHDVTRMKGNEHRGGMNCRPTKEEKENKRSRVGIEW